MILRYLSINEIYIDNIHLKFGDSRESVRMKIGGSYKESNEIISLRESIAPINKRRDIYDTLETTGDFFFLNYNENDLLIELEVHLCEAIQVLDVRFDFQSELDQIAGELSKYSLVDKKGDGEYLFNDLHISMIDEMHMGGEEKGNLSYFYCGSDISHLE